MKHKAIPKTILILSIVLILVSIALLFFAYNYNKRIGLGTSNLIRDILIEFIGKFGGNLITVALIFAILGTTGVISWKKWLN